MNKPTVKRPRLSSFCSPTAVSGFCSATAVLASPDLVVGNDEANAGSIPSAAAPLETFALVVNQQDEPFSTFLSVVGCKYYAHLHTTKLESGTTLHLEREAANEYDSNAIAALHNGIKIGHLPKETATLLAPLMDAGLIRFETVSIFQCLPTSILLSAAGVSNVGGANVLAALSSSSRSINVEALSLAIANVDVERSCSAQYALRDLNALPWNPLAGWEAPTQDGTSSIPLDATKLAVLTVDEVARCTSWPPSDAILKSLGLAPAHDHTWWYQVAGLRPPGEWHVSGALDVLPQLRVSQKQAASDLLDGAIHGVRHVWHPDTLDAMKELMEEPNFWCRRSGDALIRAFGGPYVLGQDEDNLKLVHGAPHTKLTQQICHAHNLVYAVVHLAHPVAPGFNTLIFGCNLRGAGFHYHQDAIPSLEAKNAPLIPRQPVVTTVLYESPNDEGKEVVLWKPTLNFSPRHDNDTTNGGQEYLAARALSTTHGMIHVQRAGLQKNAVHGIFHAPSAEKRKGWRVAVTARITKPQVDLQKYRNTYAAEFGPHGDLQLSRSTQLD